MLTKPRPIQRLTTPFQEFFHAETSSGILLIAVTFLALIWANSAWADSYTALWQTRLTFAIGGFEISKALLLWVNDGLMAVFFFVVGLEIKREIKVGELSTPRQAFLPIAAALGGMLMPALFYTLLNAGGPAAAGWGVPMATDIAFALGLLALLGRRAPLGLKVFLTAVAIVDDIGAVLVIAFFYTEQILWNWLLLGALVLALLFVFNRLGVRGPLPYSLLGILLWVAFLKSGVHATIAGVLLALTIPARVLIDADGFVRRNREFLERFEKAARPGGGILPNRGQRGALQALENAVHAAQAPLQRLEHMLHPWVAFCIMPIFALANAGVPLTVDLGNLLTQPLALGILLGLVFGKQLGIFAFAWLATRTGLAALPRGVSWAHVYGAAALGGIGFTMALFIANLAFPAPEMLETAKIGILAASLAAALFGWAILSLAGRRTPRPAPGSQV
ncbi:MAG: Na+/H+ antiporter NhaA [Chloroflexi bacterium]|nr:Na+/H+ antiporter NhaA [Chloroflexota bacterium]